MDRDRSIDLLAAESETLASAATEAGLATDVPSTPGWTVGDVVRHAIAGDRWAQTIVEQDEPKRVDRAELDDLPDGPELVRAYREGAAALVAALRATPADKSVWTFGSDRTAMFWVRRRPVETSIHRYDVQLAGGNPSPLDPELAVDGIDEFFDLFLKRLQEALTGVDGTIHLHCTDAAGEWLLAPGEGGITVTREHAKGDVAARGTASDLLLWLWGRVPRDDLEVFGDASLLDRFRAGATV